MAFVDTEFVLPIVPSETATFTFNTTITESQNGVEYRTPKWTEYRLEVSLDSFVLRVCEADEVDQLKDLQDFYIEVGGNLNSFRYKSLIENSVSGIAEDYSAAEDETSVYSIGQLFDRGDGSHQMVKVYQVGLFSNEDGAVRGYKTLKRIEPGSVDVFYDGVEVFNFSVDYETGRVTLNDVIPPGASTTFSCRYYHEMRFNMDALSATKIAPGEYRISGITLIEEVSTAYSPLEEDDWRRIPYEFIIPFEPSNATEVTLEIKASELVNGREKRLSRNENPENRFNLESNVVNEAEKGLFLTWFLACKGRMLDYEYGRYYSRFDSDRFSLTNVVFDDCQNYYRYVDLPLISKEAINIVIYESPPGFETEFTSVVVAPDDTPTTNINIPTTYTGGAVTGIGSSFNTSSSTSIRSFKVPNINLDAPANDPNPGTGYRLRCIFWAQNTLNILVYSSSTTSAYYRRLIHYRLTTDWQWEVVDQGGLKNYHGSTNLDNATNYTVVKTSDGVSVFVRIGNSVPFGSAAPSSPTSFGILRYELKDNGDINSYYQPESGLPAYLVNATIRFFNPGTDDIILNATTALAANVIVSEGVRWGNLNLYSVRIGLDGYPIPYTNVSTPQVNGWFRDSNFNQTWASALKPSATQPTVKQGTQDYLQFKTSNSQNITANFAFNADGYSLYRYRVSNVCESQVSCSDTKNLHSLVLGRMGATDQFKTIIINEQNTDFNSPTRRIQEITNFNDPFWNFDKYGNIIALVSNQLNFYSASGSYYVNLTNSQGIPGSNAISLINTITPWGFCWARRSSTSQDLLSGNHELYFIHAIPSN